LHGEPRLRGNRPQGDQESQSSTGFRKNGGQITLCWLATLGSHLQEVLLHSIAPPVPLLQPLGRGYGPVNGVQSFPRYSS